MFEEHVLSDRQEIKVPLLKQLWERLPAWIDQHPGRVLLLIVIWALVLGLVKLWLDPPSPEFNWENRWWQIALHVARGEGYIACKPIYFPFCGPTNQVTAMREPLPVLIFALIALLTNESLLLAAAAGVVANLAVLVAVFYLTREISSPRTALLAAFLWACYLPPVRLFYNQVSGDLFATLGITAGLIYFLRARKSNLGREWLASGILFGLAILSRSAVLVITVSLSISLLFWPRSFPQAARPTHVRWLYPALYFTFAWAVVASPWAIRNTVVFGKPVIGSTLAGYYLYRQNHTLPTDDYLRFVSGGEFVPVLEEMISRRPELNGTENEAEMDQVYREEAVKIIKTQPLRYLTLSAYRFTMLWFNWKVNEVYGKRDTLTDQLMVIQHVLLLTGGLFGLWGRFRRVWPLAISVASFSFLCMAVMAHLPYIVPVVPGLVALSAIALTQLGSSLTNLSFISRET